MAHTFQKITTPYDGPGVALFKWTGLAANECGTAVCVAPWQDKTVFVTGTFGGAVTVRGSNIVATTTQGPPAIDTATNWFAHVDPQGNAISFTSGGGEGILEAAYWFSPLAAAAVSTVDVWLFVGSSR